MRVEEYRCDYCGRRCLPEIEVTMNVSSIGCIPEAHYCSWRCLVGYAVEEMGVMIDVSDIGQEATE
jgi:hypothetical protein